MDNLSHANMLYNTRSLIYAPQVTNDHRKASSSSRNASSVSSVSNRAFLFCLSGQQFILFVFFIFTDWNISRCSPKRFSYLSLRFSGRGFFFSGFFCGMKALIPSFSVSTTLSHQILFFHILGHSGFDLKNVQIIRSANGLYL